MMGFDGDWSGGNWLAMSSLMVLFWAAFIALVIWAVRSLRDDRQPANSDRSSAAMPDDILAERYARGEIDDDEFQHRRDVLHDTRGSGTQKSSTP